MPSKKIHTLIFVFALLSFIDVKAHLLDTIPNKPFLNFKTFDDEVIRNQMKRGMEMIDNDSIDQGMRLIGESIDQLSKTTSLFRKLDYSELEIIAIMRDFGISNLSTEEKKLRNEIIAFAKIKDTEGVENVVKKAIKKNKDSELIMRIRLLVMFIENRDNFSIKDVDELLAIIPNHSPLNLLKGEMLMKEERYRESIQFLSKAIEDNPSNALAYFKIGNCHYELDENDLAIENYTKAIKLFPNYAEALNQRGDTYYYMDKYHEALADYNKAIELNPKNVYYWKDRGNAYISLGEYSNAIKDLEKAVSLYDQYDYALKRIGDCYYFLGKYESAIQFCNKAIIINPKYTHALFRKAISYGALNQSKEAIETYQQIIEIDTKYSVAYGNIGWENYMLGNYEQAIEFSEKAIALDNRASYAMFNIALATLRLGKIEEAKRLYVQYKAYCNEKNITIAKGVKDDLIAIRDQNLYVEEVNFILDEILK
jgi:tetratricopeptide (TPR) repeat protein